MFDRFTVPARRSVAFARQEARALGHESIGPEHLLLGLLRQENAPAAVVLNALGATTERARSAVLRIRGRDPNASTGDAAAADTPFSREAKDSLERALRESLSLRHPRVETGHVLLGVLGDERSGAVRVLIELGIPPEHARDGVVDAWALDLGRPGAGEA
jgi:ATP-dependent Clp protease ATP-binding subunit ClpC